MVKGEERQFRRKKERERRVRVRWDGAGNMGGIRTILFLQRASEEGRCCTLKISHQIGLLSLLQTLFISCPASLSRKKSKAAQLFDSLRWQKKSRTLRTYKGQHRRPPKKSFRAWTDDGDTSHAPAKDDCGKMELTVTQNS